MALFSSKKSTTNLSTTNNFTDQSANAAEGALAVGSGANVTIESADAEVVTAATAAMRDTAGLALASNTQVSQASLGATERTAGLSIQAQNELAGLAIKQNTDLARATQNTLLGLADVASRERSDVLNSTGTAVASARGAADKFAELASAALERSQTPDSQVTKTLLYVVGAIAIFLGLAFARRSRS